MKQYTSADVAAQLQDLTALKQEHLIVFSLNSAHELIARRTVFIGTLDSVLSHPREVFADPLADRAASIIVAHNHPSGNAEPSKQDISMTQQLIAAGLILGMPLEDHIIVGGKKHFSFLENGLISSSVDVVREGLVYESIDS